MQKMRNLLIWMLWAGLIFPCRPTHATIDSASAYSIYFHEMKDTGQGDMSEFYARNWLVWLQYHRAVEKNPMLRRQLLKLPADDTEGRKGAWALIRRQVSKKSVQSQSTHVFVLQLGVYQKASGISVFMSKRWPIISKKFIYWTNRKDFRVGYSSESPVKSEPLFLIAGQRLCYGIYASMGDVDRDARQFEKALGYRPLIKKQLLTAKLVRALIFEPVRGSRL